MVLECNSLPFPFSWGIMKILDSLFIMCFFEWLNVQMHLSVGLWISRFMPYLRLIFKESLYFLSITQVWSLRGEHKTHASVIYHMLLPHCKHHVQWQQKTAILVPFVWRVYLGILFYHIWVEKKNLQSKEWWASWAGWEAIGLCKSTEKAPGHVSQSWYL